MRYLLDPYAEYQRVKEEKINKPAHYTYGGIETLAIIKAKLTPEQYIGYLKGNAMKYTTRMGLKTGEPMGDDAGKAAYYLNELRRFEEELVRR